MITHREFGTDMKGTFILGVTRMAQACSSALSSYVSQSLQSVLAMYVILLRDLCGMRDLHIRPGPKPT